MRRFVLGLSMIILIALLSGCMITFQTQDGLLTYGLEAQGEPVGKVQAQKSFLYFLSPTIAPFDKPFESLDELLRPAMMEVGADYVKDVKIRYGITLSDYIISVLIPFIGSATVEVEGEGEKIK